MDEMWSFVQSKRQQRWLWHAVDHRTGDVLAHVLAPHEDQALEALMDRLTPFGIQQFYTDAWGAYLRLLEAEQHTVGKANTQRIEREHLTLRSRCPRLASRFLGSQFDRVVKPKPETGRRDVPDPLRQSAPAGHDADVFAVAPGGQRFAPGEAVAIAQPF